MSFYHTAIAHTTHLSVSTLTPHHFLLPPPFDRMHAYRKLQQVNSCLHAPCTRRTLDWQAQEQAAQAELAQYELAARVSALELVSADKRTTEAHLCSRELADVAEEVHSTSCDFSLLGRRAHEVGA